MIMFNKIFFSLFITLLSVAGFGNIKPKKPQLLVYGSDVEALSTALQSARSDVATLWVWDCNQILPSLPQETFAVSDNAYLDGGIWMDLLMQLANSNSKSDSIAQLQKQRMHPQIIRNIIEEWFEKEKNISIIKDKEIIRVHKNKNHWDIQLSNKKKYTVRTVVDASLDQKLVNMIGEKEEWTPLKRSEYLEKKDFRLIVGTANYLGHPHTILFKNIQETDQEGLFGLGIMKQVENIPDHLPIRFSYGQALGAVASYCSFFKTTSDKINIRLLQNELITFGARLMPFQDISIEDSNFPYLQRFSISGVLKGEINENGRYCFMKDKEVKQNEVKEVFEEMHSRSKVWFLDHDIDLFTWGDLLSYIQFVSFRGEELKTTIKKDYQKVFKFQGDFFEEKNISRYEFATIMDKFSSPYQIKINQEGEIVR